MVLIKPVLAICFEEKNCEKMLPKGSSLSAVSLYLYGKCAACNK